MFCTLCLHMGEPTNIPAMCTKDFLHFFSSVINIIVKLCNILIDNYLDILTE